MSSKHITLVLSEIKHIEHERITLISCIAYFSTRVKHLQDLKEVQLRNYDLLRSFSVFIVTTPAYNNPANLIFF